MMTIRKVNFAIVSTLGVTFVFTLFACETAPDATGSRSASESRLPARQERIIRFPEAKADDLGEPVSTVIDARPAALVNGVMVTWGDLRPYLTDLAGGIALREHILDQKIADALASTQSVIDADHVAKERKLLLESLHEDSDQALRMLDEMRQRENLGRVRFDAQMRRNAGLRALIRDRVNITEQAVQTMYDIIHGPRRQGRILTVETLSDAHRAIERLNGGETFADVAVSLSTDSSAQRGGLLEPISRSDPAYPNVLREALWSLEENEMSNPILLEGGYILIQLIRTLPADSVSMSETRNQLERLVKLNQERLLMDDLARKMLAETTVTIFDKALQDSWARFRR